MGYTISFAGRFHLDPALEGDQRIVNLNKPLRGQPSLYCKWNPTLNPLSEAVGYRSLEREVV